MVKHFCDRCEKEIKNTLYYVNISSDSIQPLNKQDDYTVKGALDAYNCLMANIPAPRIYCETCITEIKKFCGVD